MTAAKPAQPDLFALFGIAPRFDLDVKELEAAFFAKSKELHPDRFASAPAAERVVALTRSRALNDAYQTLKKAVPRAEYMLAAKGVTISDNERLDPTFLMEILELREELSEARAQGNMKVVEANQATMQSRRDALVSELPALFAANDLPAVKERLITLRYLDRYLEECDAALDD
ncbi:MAG TPA: Fe-S protein assembly co-chaperone HscB [Kofleriaceae bacterium]